MKILLDENFPLALFRSLRDAGQEIDHIIAMGWRGASDQEIRALLFDDNVLFLTQDEDFLFDEPTEALVVLSRVRQSRPLAERVEVRRQAILDLLAQAGVDTRFELLDDGTLVAWERGAGAIWKAKGPLSPSSGPD